MLRLLENALHGFANAVTQDGSDEGGKEDSKGDVPVRADQTLVGRFVSSWFNLLEESAISHWRRFLSILLLFIRYFV